KHSGCFSPHMPSTATDKRRLQNLKSKLRTAQNVTTALHADSDLKTCPLETIYIVWNESSLQRNTEFFKSVQVVKDLKEKIQIKEKELESRERENIPRGCECPVCYNWLSPSRKLDCPHSFCLRCVQTLYNAAENSITCPECRAITSKTIDQLQTNVAMERAIESHRIN
uniref:RING-type domain-containing protein n=2 Tax=Macrostomum lignano TaxID=282301 RepID=A0A1I8I6P4_9PLAT